jgi:hypothetical protein
MFNIMTNINKESARKDTEIQLNEAKRQFQQQVESLQMLHRNQVEELKRQHDEQNSRNSNVKPRAIVVRDDNDAPLFSTSMKDLCEEACNLITCNTINWKSTIEVQALLMGCVHKIKLLNTSLKRYHDMLPVVEKKAETWEKRSEESDNACAMEISRCTSINAESSKTYKATIVHLEKALADANNNIDTLNALVKRYSERLGTERSDKYELHDLRLRI